MAVNRLARLRRDAERCRVAALAAVEPGKLVAATLVRRGPRLVLTAADGSTVAEHAGPVHLVAVGKGAMAMARAAMVSLGASLKTGLVVVPNGVDVGMSPQVRLVGAGHPLPTAASGRAGRAALTIASCTGADTLLLVLVSGGASSLLTVPARGITLADKQRVTRRLLAAGADVAALNAVRKHCSQLKGGGLLRAGGRARAVWTLVLSDVLGDDLSTIGSGPTAADPTTFRDALAVLERFGLRERGSAAIVRHLETGARGEIVETLKPGDPLVARTRHVVVGNNATAVEAARRAAEALGYAAAVLPPFTGDAAEAGRALAARVRALPPTRATALLAGGEPTVRVRAGGRGGRAQHLALAAALALDGVPAVVLAVGTDGVDGPTDAAGALVDGGLVARARARNIDLATALDATDSHPVLERLGVLVRTGPTGTNVTDLVVALRAAC
jgi:hydroxypyruvate reductase